MSRYGSTSASVSGRIAQLRRSVLRSIYAAPFAWIYALIVTQSGGKGKENLWRAAGRREIISNLWKSLLCAV